MAADVRGFRYPLEPLLRRQGWQLEAAQARLGRATREVSAKRNAIERREEGLRRQDADAARSAAARFDPVHQHRNLQWLAREREAIAAERRELEALRRQRAEIAADCLARQNRLQVIEDHREDRVADYAQEQQGRQAAAADAEWLARRAVEEVR